jgi:hypothetical protein
MRTDFWIASAYGNGSPSAATKIEGEITIVVNGRNGQTLFG